MTSVGDGFYSNGNYKWRDNEGMDSGRMNTPVVVALLLSIVLFILCLWFFLSPAFVQRCYTQTRPMDPEDGYFIDPDSSRPSPYTSTGKSGFSASMRSFGHVAAPPPAYTSRAQHGPTFFKQPGSTSRFARRPSSFRRLFALPKALRRSASAPLVISRPIPLPEFPLPGPDVLTEADIRALAAAAEADMTLVRPCAAPPRSVSENTLHAHMTRLPAPSHAVVRTRDSDASSFRPPSSSSAYLPPPSHDRVRNTRDSDASSFRPPLCSSTYLPAPRASFQLPAFAPSGTSFTAEFDTSVASSRVGLAF